MEQCWVKRKSLTFSVFRDQALGRLERGIEIYWICDQAKQLDRWVRTETPPCLWITDINVNDAKVSLCQSTIILFLDVVAWLPLRRLVEWSHFPFLLLLTFGRYKMAFLVTETKFIFWWLLVTFGSFWQSLATNDNFWQLLETQGNIVEVLTPFGIFFTYFGQHLAILGNFCHPLILSYCNPVTWLLLWITWRENSRPVSPSSQFGSWFPSLNTHKSSKPEHLKVSQKFPVITIWSESKTMHL